METSRLLEGNGPRYRLTVDERAQFPGFFTMALVRGCSCGHHRRGCGGACGRGCCFEDHDLAAWDPSACGLRPFIDQAVRGRPGRKIFGGAFAESLTYRFLEPPDRILCRPVEFKRCPECGMLYEEPVCPQMHGGTIEEQPVVHIARSNWLIVPEHVGGNYREIIRWRCGDVRCKNLYPIRFTGLREASPCPVCGWSPAGETKPGKVTVWVRVPAGHQDLQGRRRATAAATPMTW
jgi:hypothetical protein